MHRDIVSIFVDTSNGYVGLIIGSQLLIKEELNKPLQKACGKIVHMRELSKSTKIKIAYRFMKLASLLCEKHEIELICTRKDLAFSWVAKLVERQFRKKVKIPVFYVDVGIDLELKKNIHPFYYRLMHIIVDKPLTQCSDVFSWINLRKNQIKFIWDRLSNHVLEVG